MQIIFCQGRVLNFRMKLIPVILVIISSTNFAQLYEHSEKEATDILISLSQGKPTTSVNLEKLTQSFNSYLKSQKPPNPHSVPSQELESLKQSLEEFESVSKDLSPDSALVLFHQWYLHFQTIFYEYSSAKFFSARNTKILFFSTSLSCHCTLEMCRNQVIDILQFLNENNQPYDYWVVDSFAHPELAARYHALFLPAVIIFNDQNKVLYKIEYEENMLVDLTKYLSDNLR